MSGIHIFTDIQIFTVCTLSLDLQITKIENLECLVNLEVLDISFNRLRAIEGLEKLTKLKRLFLVSNKITKIENLGHLKDLELLELGDNRSESTLKKIILKREKFRFYWTNISFELLEDDKSVSNLCYCMF